ncbi:MAG: zf-TFIIB domain-containing protein [Chloroflexota bacterium]|nr:zf-TFIIB domain-containing protein [Chloroflexota bacterium]
MKCPKCGNILKKKSHKSIEVDYCANCKGMWLDLDELDQLEDNVFDEDRLKGTLIFSSVVSEHHCPHCDAELKQFRYRLHDLELEFCENQHGFWLDEGEEKRVLELMKIRKKNMKRKSEAEEDWGKTLHQLKSKSFLNKLGGLFK